MSWKKFTHREHILARPDTYVGPIENVMNKIFQEIIVNASDEYLRDSKSNHIDVTIEGNSISVANNKCIPVIKHEEEGLWLIELIFGHLLTSSNFDDTDVRYTGGRNGYGAKLTNIFSKKFTVTSCDPVNGLEYSQTWENNMSVCNEPKMKKYSKKTGRTIITFEPDLSRVPSISIEDLQNITIETGLWVPKVYFNGSLVSGSLEDYAKIQEPDQKFAKMNCGDWEIIAGRSTDGFKQYSFVNGLRTSRGGTHVNYIVNEICKHVSDGRVSQIKPHLVVFVKVLLDKPVFSSQTKNELETIIRAGTVDMKPKFVKDLLATGLDRDLEKIEQGKLKKSDGSKQTRLKGIPELDDANWAGGTKSEQCTLIVTEGLSAKALAIAGLSVVGRNSYGVFPLRGKPKNVRDSAVKSLEKNKEFMQLKQILGLKQGENYENTKKLRYGRILIMTDADLDGSHIKGLVLNMFHVFWPSLIKIGFVCAMVTPVVKRGASEWFYTEEAFKNAPEKSGTTKYYKGLGTSTSAEAKEYFKNIEKLTVRFEYDRLTDDSMMLAFAKTQIQNRKDWLLDYMKGSHGFVNYGHITKLPVSEFINVDFIKFSNEDIHRSIPHLADGLKPSQRCVIYAGKKKGNLEKELNVCQFSGYIAEHTEYHHGETSLHGTIIGLAQDFVGSNNINLLLPCGQFGSRLEGGDDAASVRYIFTKFAPVTRKIFDYRDDEVLSGTPVPDFYIPVLPMCLVNGCEGIGTGFSCKIPPFNPVDLKENILRILNREPMKKMNPWYKGFTGKVTKTDDTTWTLEGNISQETQGVYKVTELPPGLWTQKFKESLEDAGLRYENHSTETHPNFVVYSDGTFACPKKNIHSTNMYLITPNGIRKFESAEEILFEYTKLRLHYYKLRKANIKETITKRLGILQDKIKFITAVIDGKLKVFARPKSEIKSDLDAMNLGIEMLKTPTEEYTAEKIVDLNNTIRELGCKLEEVIKTSTADMWKKDLSDL